MSYAKLYSFITSWKGYVPCPSDQNTLHFYPWISWLFHLTHKCIHSVTQCVLGVIPGTASPIPALCFQSNFIYLWNPPRGTSGVAAPAQHHLCACRGAPCAVWPGPVSGLNAMSWCGSDLCGQQELAIECFRSCKAGRSLSFPPRAKWAMPVQGWLEFTHWQAAFWVPD